MNIGLSADGLILETRLTRMFLKENQMNRDKHGIIGQIQPSSSAIRVEGGDSVNWMGHWLYLNDGKDEFFSVKRYIRTFMVSWGAWVRHPDPEMTNNGFGAHYKHPWNGCISRDQLTGILAILIQAKRRWVILQMMIHHMAWGMFFAYNNINNGDAQKKWKWPDPALVSIWAMYLRGLFGWLAWPVLCVLDFHLFFSTIHENADEDPDSISYAMRFMVSQEHTPTPTSKWAAKILDVEQLLSEIKEYWCGWRDGCEFYELTRKRFVKLGLIKE